MSFLPPSVQKDLSKACRVAKDSARRVGIILFVSADPRSASVVKSEAERAGMPYVTGRWLAGTLTNYSTLRTRIARLLEIERWESGGTLKRYTKKERSVIAREKLRLEERVGGLRAMTSLPAALILIRPAPDSIPLAEARKTGAAVIALGETDRLQAFDASVPVARESIPTVLARLSDAIILGKPPQFPPGPSSKERPRGPRPPDTEGPGTAPVPARLRPRPSPRRGSAPREPD